MEWDGIGIENLAMEEFITSYVCILNKLATLPSCSLVIVSVSSLVEIEHHH